MNRRGLLAGALAACAAPAFVRYGSLMVPRPTVWAGFDLAAGADDWRRFVHLPPDPTWRLWEDLDVYYRRLAAQMSGIPPVTRGQLL